MQRELTQQEHDRMYERLIEFINEQYDRSDITLDDFCTSKFYYRRTVQRMLWLRDTSWRELLHERRMEMARWKLSRSNKTIQQIAWEIGYNQASQFSKTFRQHHGKTPTEFREDAQRPRQAREEVTA